MEIRFPLCPASNEELASAIIELMAQNRALIKLLSDKGLVDFGEYISKTYESRAHIEKEMEWMLNPEKD